MTAFALWKLDDRIPDCAKCEALFWKTSLKRFGPSPCWACTIPRLYEENEQAWDVLRRCSSQLRVVGMGTSLGIEFDAIIIAMDMAGVNHAERRVVFEKVRLAGEAYAALLNRRADEERKASDPNYAKTTHIKLQPPKMLKTADGATAVRDRAEASASRLRGRDHELDGLACRPLAREDFVALGHAVSSDPSGVGVTRTPETVRLCRISTLKAAADLKTEARNPN